MKNTTKILAFIITFSIMSCNSHNNKHTTISLRQDLIMKYEPVFNDLKKNLAEENGKLWAHQLYGPIMFVDRNSRTIIANEPDTKGILTKEGNVYIGILPKEINLSNTAHNWNGKRWTMLRLPLPKDYNERLDLLTHELFHRIQPELGFKKINNKNENHLDDKTARVFLKLELNALKKALMTNNDSISQIHIRNALLFRNYRDALFTNEKKEENTLEINEGLAEYTGSILSKRTDKKLKEHYIKAINSFYNNRTFVRSFAYVTIPVYGYFMNKKNPNWNKAITKKTNLTDFITTFFKVTIPTNLKDIVDKLKANYGYDKISAIERERANEHKKLIEKYKTEFLKNPTLTITFEKMNISFDPRNIMPFENLGTIYPSIRITDNWGILTAKNGALLSKNWDKVMVSVPTSISDTLVEGNGWKIELNTAWKIVKRKNNYLLKRK